MVHIVDGHHLFKIGQIQVLIFLGKRAGHHSLFRDVIGQHRRPVDVLLPLPADHQIIFPVVVHIADQRGCVKTFLPVESIHHDPRRQQQVAGRVKLKDLHARFFITKSVAGDILHLTVVVHICDQRLFSRAGQLVQLARADSRQRWISIIADDLAAAAIGGHHLFDAVLIQIIKSQIMGVRTGVALGTAHRQ
ncbi:MAG: hypothetical protein BWY83_01912 [bacterium ADurb.Bin478]|nr:MAG: hypothetical protein BWY83_01912 [bacterium ADurb.Bin478]